MPQLRFPAVCCWAIHTFGVLLDKAGMWLTDSEACRAVQLGRLYASTYLALAGAAIVRSRPLYKVRPKQHQFVCEVVLKLHDGSRFNPRYASCFGDEDYVGRVCGAAKLASHPSTMSKRVLQRCMCTLNAWLSTPGQKCCTAVRRLACTHGPCVHEACMAFAANTHEFRTFDMREPLA